MEKDRVKDTLMTGIFGAPEIKPDEKRKYLGQFKENVVAVIGSENMGDMEIGAFIKRAIKDHGGQYIIIDNDVAPDVYAYILREVKDLGVDVTLYKNADRESDIKILVGSENPIGIKDQPLQFKRRLPDKFRQAKSNYLCSRCFKELEQISPETAENFKLIGMIEKIAGIKCGVCQDTDNGPLM